MFTALQAAALPVNRLDPDPAHLVHHRLALLHHRVHPVDLIAEQIAGRIVHPNPRAQLEPITNPTTAKTQRKTPTENVNANVPSQRNAH